MDNTKNNTSSFLRSLHIKYYLLFFMKFLVRLLRAYLEYEFNRCLDSSATSSLRTTLHQLCPLAVSLVGYGDESETEAASITSMLISLSLCREGWLITPMALQLEACTSLSLDPMTLPNFVVTRAFNLPRVQSIRHAPPSLSLFPGPGSWPRFYPGRRPLLRE